MVTCSYGPDGNLYVGLAAAPGVKRWDGAAWSTVGSGVNGRVNALAWLAGKLHVGGQFSLAGGAIAIRPRRGPTSSR